MEVFSSRKNPKKTQAPTKLAQTFPALELRADNLMDMGLFLSEAKCWRQKPSTMGVALGAKDTTYNMHRC